MVTPTLTRVFLVLAIVTSGFLAGLNIDRALVAMPAWHQVGANDWGEFSRHADLGNGRILYPLEAFGALLLTLVATIGYHIDRRVPRAATVLLDTAVLLLIGGLVFTAKAAPVMLSIEHMSDPGALQHAFEEFWYWGNLRGTCQVLAFIAQTAALGMLWRCDNPVQV
jgi:hypothetical protein